MLCKVRPAHRHSMPANLFRRSFYVHSYLRRLTFKRADEFRKTLPYRLACVLLL